MTIKVCIDCSASFKEKAKYVFDMFFSVMGVPYQLCGITAENIDIYYGLNRQIGLINIPVEDYKKWIKNRPSVNWVKDVPLLYVQQEPNDLFDCDFISASFYLLSRQEEYTDARRDKWNCFSGKYSILRELNLLEFPVINSYINLIREKLQIKKPAWKDGKDFAVALTHDVDWSFKWDARDGIKLIRPAEKFSGLKTAASMIIGDMYKKIFNKEDPQLSFKNWSSLENKYGFKSSFYFLSLTDGKGTVYDTNYIDNPKLYDLVKKIHSDGWEVGVHGSYDSYNDAVKLRNEKIKLEEILGAKITGVRQHYLRFDIKTTWDVQQQADFRYGTTLGYNEALGFRAGIAFPFHPYDSKTQSRMRLIELPVTIMDGVLFLEEKLDVQEATKRCIKLLELVKRYNGFASLIWHPMYWGEREYPGWRKTYENIIEYLSKQNVWVTSSEEIAEWWLKRC